MRLPKPRTLTHANTYVRGGIRRIWPTGNPMHTSSATSCHFVTYCIDFISPIRLHYASAQSTATLEVHNCILREVFSPKRQFICCPEALPTTFTRFFPFFLFFFILHFFRDASFCDVTLCESENVFETTVISD